MFNAVRGSQQAENSRTQAIFEAARMQAFFSVNIWAKTPLNRPRDLMTFPWEEEPQDSPEKIEAGVAVMKQLTAKGSFKQEQQRAARMWNN